MEESPFEQVAEAGAPSTASGGPGASSAAVRVVRPRHPAGDALVEVRRRGMTAVLPPDGPVAPEAFERRTPDGAAAVSVPSVGRPLAATPGTGPVGAGPSGCLRRTGRRTRVCRLPPYIQVVRAGGAGPTGRQLSFPPFPFTPMSGGI
ncbi:DUF6424 family protein [Streptomyces populi]